MFLWKYYIVRRTGMAGRVLTEYRPDNGLVDEMSMGGVRDPRTGMDLRIDGQCHRLIATDRLLHYGERRPGAVTDMVLATHWWK